MTIRVSEDYHWKQIMYEGDMHDAYHNVSKSYASNYTPTFKTVDVATIKEIEEYVSNGWHPYDDD